MAKYILNGRRRWERKIRSSCRSQRPHFSTNPATFHFNWNVYKTTREQDNQRWIHIVPDYLNNLFYTVQTLKILSSPVTLYWNPHISFFNPVYDVKDAKAQTLCRVPRSRYGEIVEEEKALSGFLRSPPFWWGTSTKSRNLHHLTQYFVIWSELASNKGNCSLIKQWWRSQPC